MIDILIKQYYDELKKEYHIQVYERGCCKLEDFRNLKEIGESCGKFDECFSSRIFR